MYNARKLVCELLLLVVLGLGAPGLARSAPGNIALARQHYKRGRLLYSQGKFRAAIGQFTKAQSYKSHPSIQFNLGQCHRQLREYARALFFYKLYLLELPQASNRKEVQRFILMMTRKAAEAARLRQLGKVSVITRPTGAQIFVNSFSGTPRGASPATLSLKVGQHVLVVRLAGHHTVYRKVTIHAGKVTLVRLALQRLGPARTVVVPPRPRPGGERIPPPRPPVSPPRPVPRRGRVRPPPPRPRVIVAPRRLRAATTPRSSKRPQPFYKTTWFWSGVAVGVGTVVLGSVFGKLALNKEQEWQREVAARPGDPDRDIQRTGRAFAATTDALLAVGIISLAAVTTAAILVARKQRKERRSKTVWWPGCGARGCGIWVRSRF